MNAPGHAAWQAGRRLRMLRVWESLLKNYPTLAKEKL